MKKLPLADGGYGPFTPHQFLRRLAAIVPPPRAHLTGYHGVFAARSRLRQAVAPKPKKPAGPRSLSPSPKENYRTSRGLTCSSASSTAKPTAGRTAELTAPVRITHPFHPLFGQELDLVVRRARFGENRVFFRNREGHLASLPAQWTSLVPEDPCVAAGAGRSAFLATDLLELANLLLDLKP